MMPRRVNRGRHPADTSIEALRFDFEKAVRGGQLVRIVEAANQYGVALRHEDRFKPALEVHRKELWAAEALNKPVDLIVANRGVAESLVGLGRYAQAESAAERALQLASDNHKGVEVQRMQHVLGQVYLAWAESLPCKGERTQYLDKAKTCYGEAERTLHTIYQCKEVALEEYRDCRSRLLSNLALVAKLHGDLAEAVAAAERVLTIVHAPVGELTALLVYAESQLKINHTAAQLGSRLRRAVGLARRLKRADLQAEAYERLGQKGMLDGKFAEAQRLFRHAKRASVGAGDADRYRSQWDQAKCASALQQRLRQCAPSDHQSLKSLNERMGDKLAHLYPQLAIGYYECMLTYVESLSAEGAAAAGALEECLSSLALTARDLKRWQDSLVYYRRLQQFETTVFAVVQWRFVACRTAYVQRFSSLTAIAQCLMHLNQPSCLTELQLADTLLSKEGRDVENVLDLKSYLYRKWVLYAKKFGRVTKELDGEWASLRAQYVQTHRIDGDQPPPRVDVEVKRRLKELLAFDTAEYVAEEATDSSASESEDEGEQLAIRRRNRRNQLERKNRLGETPLHIAARQTNLGAVERLIAEGAKVNASDNNGWRPIHEAANYGRLENARALIEAGALVDVRATANPAVTPLLDAAVNEHFQLVELLLDRGATHLDAYESTTGLTTIDYAVNFVSDNRGDTHVDVLAAARVVDKLKAKEAAGARLHPRHQAEPIVDDEDDLAEEVGSPPKQSRLSDGDGAAQYQQAMSSIGSRAQLHLRQRSRRPAVAPLVDDSSHHGSVPILDDEVIEDEDDESPPAPLLPSPRLTTPVRAASNEDLYDVGVGARSPSGGDDDDDDDEPLVVRAQQPARRNRPKRQRQPRLERFSFGRGDAAPTALRRPAIGMRREVAKPVARGPRQRRVAVHVTYSTGVDGESWSFALVVEPDDTLGELRRRVTEAVEQKASRTAELRLATGENPPIELVGDAPALVAIGDGGDVTAIVDGWLVEKLVPRYERFCALSGTRNYANVRAKLAQVDNSGAALSLSGCVLKENAVTPVLKALQQQQNSLTSLNLSGCHLSASAKELAVALTSLRSLQSLSMQSAGLTADALKQLNVDLKSSLANIESLDLSFNTLGNGSLSAFCALLTRLPNLAELAVQSVGVSSLFFECGQFGSALRGLKRLRSLDVSLNVDMGEGGVRLLLGTDGAALHLASPATLDVSNTFARCSDRLLEALVVFAQANADTLECLRLNHVALFANGGAKVVARALIAACRLRRIELADTDLSVEAAVAMLEDVEQHAMLRELDLSHCAGVRVGGELLDALLARLRARQLAELRLVGVAFDVGAAGQLTAAWAAVFHQRANISNHCFATL